MKIEVAIEVAMCIPRTDPKNCKVYPKNESQEFDPKKSRNVSHQMQQNSRDTFLGTLLGIHYKFLGTILGIHDLRGVSVQQKRAAFLEVSHVYNTVSNRTSNIVSNCCSTRT